MLQVFYCNYDIFTFLPTSFKLVLLQVQKNQWTEIKLNQIPVLLKLHWFKKFIQSYCRILQILIFKTNKINRSKTSWSSQGFLKHT